MPRGVHYLQPRKNKTRMSLAKALWPKNTLNASQLVIRSAAGFSPNTSSQSSYNTDPVPYGYMYKSTWHSNRLMMELLCLIMRHGHGTCLNSIANWRIVVDSHTKRKGLLVSREETFSAEAPYSFAWLIKLPGVLPCGSLPLPMNKWWCLGPASCRSWQLLRKFHRKDELLFL